MSSDSESDSGSETDLNEVAAAIHAGVFDDDSSSSSSDYDIPLRDLVGARDGDSSDDDSVIAERLFDDQIR